MLPPMDLSAIIERCLTIRHDLHRHPELAYAEHRTAGIVRGVLDEQGIPWRAAAGTGTIADLGPAGDGRIALRADMDALPLQEKTGLPYASCCDGRMHACGHDGHTASLLAAAMVLKQHEQGLRVGVRLLFQPAEEGQAGAQAMIADGCLDGVAQIFGYHNWPPIPYGQVACVAGPIMAANGEFTLTIHGRGGHASQPEGCVDPVFAAAAVITGLQTIVSRETAPQQAAVVSVTRLAGGSANNIIPDEVRLHGTARALTTLQRARIAERIGSLANALAAAHGCTATYEWHDIYPATVNDSAAAAQAREVLARLTAIEGFIEGTSLPIMGAEDFSFYQEQIPGCYVLIGSGRPGEQLEVCHSPRFDYNDALLPIACAYFCGVVGITV